MAIAKCLSNQKSNIVTLYQRNKNSDKFNQDYIKNLYKITDNLENIINNHYIFICVPSKNFEAIINNIAQTAEGMYSAKHFQKSTIVICSKGIFGDTKQPFFSSLIENKLDKKYNIAVLSGPSFADEIINKSKTIVTIAAKRNIGKKISSLFNYSNISTRLTSAIKETQIMFVLKNIIAIRVGFLSAKNVGMNEITAEILEYIYEFSDIFKKLKYSKDIMLEPAAIGDIILTSFSDKSRNRKFGIKLAESNNEAKEFYLNNTVEGVFNALILQSYLLENNLESKKINEFVLQIKEIL